MAQTNSQVPTIVIPNTLSGVDWTTPNNILIPDNLFAVATGSTQILVVGYVGNINIPVGATIDNIVVSVKGYRGSFNTTLQIYALDSTSGVTIAYPMSPFFQGFDGTNTLYALTPTLFGNTWTVDAMNNFALKLIADGELHMDCVEVNVIYTPAIIPTPTTVLNYDTLAGGTFAPGDTITGGTSGATADVVTDDGVGAMTITNVVGTFQIGETIDNGSGVTATVINPTGLTVVNEFVQAQPFQLAQSMTSTSLTMLLSSFNYPNGDPIFIGDFHGEAMMTIEQGVPGKEENVRIVDVQHDFNGSGFTQISFGVLANRGLGYQYPYTTVTGLRQDHSGTAEVVISNSAPFYDRFLKKAQIGALVSAPVSVFNNGVLLDSAVNIIRLTGAGKTAILNALHDITIDIPGGGSGILNNLNATTAPTINDDSGDGYAIGSLWFNKNTGFMYVAEDVTVGAAVWTQVGGTGGGSVNSVTSSDAFIVVDNTDPANPILSLDVTALANDTTFITALTNNSTFQSNVNNFISGGGGGIKLAIEANDVQIVGVTTEEIFYSINIPGGTLGIDNAIRFKLIVDQTTDGSGTSVFRFKYGGVTFASINSSFASNVQGEFNGVIVANEASGAQKTIVIQLSGGSDNQEYYDEITVDSTVDQDLEFTFQAANALNDITGKAVIVEKISSSSGGDKKVGVGETSNTEWFNIQIPFSVLPTNFNTWALSVGSFGPMACAMGNGGTLTTPGDGLDRLFWNFADDDIYTFAQSTPKGMVVEGTVYVGPDNQDAGWGIAAIGQTMINPVAGNDEAFGFIRDTGVWYSYVGDGTTHTKNAITVSANSSHVFRVEYNPATPNALFFVDGILVDTITTTFPVTSLLGVKFEAGNAAQQPLTTIGCPSFAVEI